MFKNYLITAYRNIVRQKTYSAINIIGFALGLAVCLAITFYVVDDLSYDRFHADAENIYHVLTHDTYSHDEALSYSITNGPLVAGLKENIPEITKATRIGQLGLNLESQIGGDEERERVRGRTLMVDPEFFEIFSFKILETTQETVLEDFTGVYITREFGKRLFGDRNPVGEAVPNNTIEGAYVAGIVEEHPRNSHLHYDAIVKLDIRQNPIWWDSWENLALQGYFKISKNADPAVVESKIVDFARSQGIAEVFKPGMQPLLDVHLNSNHLRYDYLNFWKNDKVKVYPMAIIAILVLIIASINFINLSSARAIRRAKEVGLRKVVGGTYKQLFGQFLFESVLTTLLAMVLALGLFEIFLPHLNDFFGKNLSFNLIENYKITLSIVGASVLIGLISGLYPATILSHFKPVTVLRGKLSNGGKKLNFRHVLVICQFAVSIALISSVFIVIQQLQYLSNVDLGYDKNDVLILNNFDNEPFKLLKEDLKNQQFVESIGASSNLPGATFVRLEVVAEDADFDKGLMFDRMFIDEGFIETLNIDLVEGRNYSAELVTDVDESIIINKTAAKSFGWDDPIGKRITMIDENEARLTRRIIGVIDDINFSTAKRKVNPMILPFSPEFDPLLMVKIKPGSVESSLEAIERIYHEYLPEAPFHPDFLEDIYLNQFGNEEQFAINIAVFSILAIVIACLGLLGLASYTTQQRRREIAIRKVLGSSVRSVVVLLSKDFTIWVIIANCIGWPLAYFSMKIWLNNFIYKTNPNILIFLMSGAIALIVALLTVSAQTFKAANGDPVNSLKWEG